MTMHYKSRKEKQKENKSAALLYCQEFEKIVERKYKKIFLLTLPPKLSLEVSHSNSKSKFQPKLQSGILLEKLKNAGCQDRDVFEDESDHLSWETYPLSFQTKNLEMKFIPNKGLGIFARRRYKKDSVITGYPGIIETCTDIETLSERAQKYSLEVHYKPLKSACLLIVPTQAQIISPKAPALGHIINSVTKGRKPNVAFLTYTRAFKAQLKKSLEQKFNIQKTPLYNGIVYALRDILANEELLVDYGTYYNKIGFI